MSISDVIKKSFLEQFEKNDISASTIFLTLIIAYLVALYIHYVYKYATKSAFYFKNYGIAMTIMSVITAGIVLSMQSNVVISLGMVGALSIVRFRTAIKDPLDLLFLFWSIGNGIICGAGLFEVAILTSVIATIGIVLFRFEPVRSKSELLVINSKDIKKEDEILKLIQDNTKYFKIKSRNYNTEGANYIIEIISKNSSSLIQVINSVDNISMVSLLENDVDLKS